MNSSVQTGLSALSVCASPPTTKKREQRKRPANMRPFMVYLRIWQTSLAPFVPQFQEMIHSCPLSTCLASVSFVVFIGQREFNPRLVHGVHEFLDFFWVHRTAKRRSCHHQQHQPFALHGRPSSRETEITD